MEMVSKLECMLSRKTVFHYKIFARIYQSLCENATFKKRTADFGRPQKIWTGGTWRNSSEFIAKSPDISTGKNANILKVIPVFEITDLATFCPT